MSAHRCSGCDRNWPPTTKYNNCPICKVPTWVSAYHEPNSTTETSADTSARNHKDFTTYVAKQEQELELEFSAIIARSFDAEEIDKLKRYADNQADTMQRKLDAVHLPVEEMKKDSGGHDRWY